MRTVGAWLDGREPAPPAPLAAALRGLRFDSLDLGAEGGRAGVDLGPALAGRACERLEMAAARPGRRRESAFRLLEADALFTYACEAALEESDSEGALRRILTAASRSR